MLEQNVLEAVVDQGVVEELAIGETLSIAVVEVDRAWAALGRPDEDAI